MGFLDGAKAAALSNRAYKEHAAANKLADDGKPKEAGEKYRAALLHLKRAGVLDAVNGILVGKPQDEVFDAEYRQILQEVVDDPAKPILCNLPVGHAMPRCILPFGVDAEVDAEAQVIRFA